MVLGPNLAPACDSMGTGIRLGARTPAAVNSDNNEAHSDCLSRNLVLGSVCEEIRTMEQPMRRLYRTCDRARQGILHVFVPVSDLKGANNVIVR